MISFKMRFVLNCVLIAEGQMIPASKWNMVIKKLSSNQYT